MMAEIFPALYDVHGRRVLNPGANARQMGFRPTAPMGSFATDPLETECKNLEEMRKFLMTCRGRNMHATQSRDHWQAPSQFEKTKAGDCVDFGLWAWRQVLAMGYPARFVGGKSGKFGEGHAWVTFEKNGRHFLVEPQLRPLGLRMPRISTLRYHPKVSVVWDGKKIQYFEHEDRSTDPPLRLLPALLAEWLLIWAGFWIQFLYKVSIGLPRLLGRTLLRVIRRS
jgi:hypothetical protein